MLELNSNGKWSAKVTCEKTVVKKVTYNGTAKTTTTYGDSVDIHFDMDISEKKEIPYVCPFCHKEFSLLIQPKTNFSYDAQTVRELLRKSLNKRLLKFLISLFLTVCCVLAIVFFHESMGDTGMLIVFPMMALMGYLFYAMVKLFRNIKARGNFETSGTIPEVYSFKPCKLKLVNKTDMHSWKRYRKQDIKVVSMSFGELPPFGSIDEAKTYNENSVKL